MTDTPAVPTTTRSDEYAEMVDGEWTWLYDSYDAGTVFITDDPMGSQTPIAEGLKPDDATSIVAAHNMTVRAFLIEARSTPAEALDVPLKGIWVIDGDPQPSPGFFDGLGNALKDARARGDEVIVHQGIELRWRPIVIESHQVVWVDPGRDEPPESGFWRCACGATFAPDGVDEYAAHLTPDRGRIGRVQSPEDGS